MAMMRSASSIASHSCGSGACSGSYVILAFSLNLARAEMPLWHNHTMRRTIVFLIAAATLAAQPAPTNGRRARRLLIHNATVVDGNGTPASGPKDILIENNVIADVIALDPVSLARAGGRGAVAAPDAAIDATGKYVLPGLINAHAHLQEERGGKPQPIEYELNIWLACGITAVRDVGSDTKRA